MLGIYQQADLNHTHVQVLMWLLTNVKKKRFFSSEVSGNNIILHLTLVNLSLCFSQNT